MATAMVAVANDEENDLFAFTCSSHYADVADTLKLPKSKFGTCVDSSASTDYSPDHSKFSNYREIEKDITVKEILTSLHSHLVLGRGIACSQQKT